jgi:proline iminopeptidase
MRSMFKLAGAYYHNPSLRVMMREILTVGMRTKARPEAQIFAFGHLLNGWTVMDQLGEIQVPTLVLAGRDDFQFPPEHQAILADRMPDARLVLIELAGHNAPTERPAQVIHAVRDFMATARPNSA